MPTPDTPYFAITPFQTGDGSPSKLLVLSESGSVLLDQTRLLELIRAGRMNGLLPGVQTDPLGR